MGETGVVEFPQECDPLAVRAMLDCLYFGKYDMSTCSNTNTSHEETSAGGLKIQNAVYHQAVLIFTLAVYEIADRIQHARFNIPHGGTFPSRS
jgi:hypothetical protein